jgi:16S rRNA C967 or C1407 C5-methylase (RsmB/RsmF family)
MTQAKKRKRDQKFKTAGAAPAKKVHKPNVWQDWTPITYENAAYEEYYKRQGVCPTDEWPELLASLKTPLPQAVRVNSLAPTQAGLVAALRELATQSSAVAPRHLPWYPGECAWQWDGLDRRAIKKGPSERVKALKAFLVEEEKQGGLSRQETVSMIPVELLGVKPGHIVLDMCAAPGSKTGQIVERLAGQGLVVANDVDWKRANLLAHQVHRFGSPCIAVTHMDASFTPYFWTDGAQLRFDRILCDVLCTGDGTMRKAPEIWKSWVPHNGCLLHEKQCAIVCRGLELLAPGGQLVYSTCSFNPVEDEAVVATALLRMDGAAELVAPPDLPGLRGADGITKWVVQGKVNGKFYESFEEASGDSAFADEIPKVAASMFVPTGERAEAVLAQLHRCRRFLPHRMNTGGFFCAIFRKTAEAPSKKAHGRRAQEEEEANKGEDARGDGQKELLRGVTKDVTPLATPEFDRLHAFFGLAKSVEPAQLIARDSIEGKLFLLTPDAARFAAARARCALRVVHLGTHVFTRCEDFTNMPPWRIAQQGAASLMPLCSRRVLRVSADAMKALLEFREVSLEDMKISTTERELVSRDGRIEPGPAFLHLPEHSMVVAVLLHEAVVQVEKGQLEHLRSVLNPRSIVLPPYNSDEAEEDKEDADGDEEGDAEDEEEEAELVAAA